MNIKHVLMEGAGDGIPNSGGAGGGAGGDGGAGDALVDRPDFIPEKFWDASSGQAKVEDLARSYSEMEKSFGSRKEQFFEEFEKGRLANRPETAEGYSLEINPADLELPEGVQVNIDDNDPMVAWWRERAHEAGFSNEQFNEGIKQYMKHELGGLRDMEKEREALGENAQARIDRVELWMRKQVGDDLFNEIQYSLGNHKAVIALEKLMKNSGSIDLTSSDGHSPGKLSKNEIRAMMDDPRYWRDSDPAYIEKVNKAWEQLHKQG